MSRVCVRCSRSHILNQLSKRVNLARLMFSMVQVDEYLCGIIKFESLQPFHSLRLVCILCVGMKKYWVIRAGRRVHCANVILFDLFV